MKYIVKKTGTLIITLLIVSFLSFMAFSVIPGDAAKSKLGTEATKEQIEALQHEMGLDKPRPSGTEPKIKYYFGVKGTSMKDAQRKLERVKEDMMKLEEPRNLRICHGRSGEGTFQSI